MSKQAYFRTFETNKKFISSSILLFILFLFVSCKETKKSSSIEDRKATKNISEQKKENTKLNIKIYSLPHHPFLDDSSKGIIAFKNFQAKMKQLAKLNPSGLEVFLLETIKSCNELTKSQLTPDLDVFPIKSRLKAVKTELLKCHYYSSKNNLEMLTSEMEKLYTTYNDYLKRINSLILGQEKEIE